LFLLPPITLIVRTNVKRIAGADGWRAACKTIAMREMPSDGQLCFEISRDKTRHCAADKDFHLASLDATHNPVLQGCRGAIDTILRTVFLVAVGSAGSILPHRFHRMFNIG
jgi:GntR family transcriptional regulator, galactonate operon transcriptional repressor